MQQIKLRGTLALTLALAIQVLIISVFPDRFTATHVPAHLGSYALAGVFFWLNRRVPGLWITGLGGGLNLVAIAANGGVMPASATAVAASGAPTADAGAFINSTAMAAPRLAWLGDVFALPSIWPLSNVFSIGDVLIILGVAIVLHRAGRSCASSPSGPPS
ncbi:MAG: hypothetical protein GEU74_08860 [Nitriliruptorales bacterium]|nr:hypothetical protein [Nitriliruptorales bacterium]